MVINKQTIPPPIFLKQLAKHKIAWEEAWFIDHTSFPCDLAMQINHFDLDSTCCHVQNVLQIFIYSRNSRLTIVWTVHTVIHMTAWQIMLCAEFRIWIVALAKDLFKHGWTTWFARNLLWLTEKNSYLLKNQI